MIHEKFEKIDGPAANDFLNQVNPLLPIAPFDAQSTTILSRELSFYPGYKLTEIQNKRQTPPVQINLIYRDQDIHILDWSNTPIYQLNQEVPITLNEQTVISYVTFFFHYVRGKHGRFLFVENVDDINWREDPPPAARKAIGKMLQPVQITQKNADGSFELLACMIFKDSLFQSKITVEPHGHVTLFDEELLIEDMPVIDDVLGQ